MKRLIIILIMMPLLFACGKKETVGSDVDRITDSDTLRVATLSRSTSYFDIQGVEMGYEYELAQNLADYLHVNLKVETGKDIDEMVMMLQNGVVDVIAYPVPITTEGKSTMSYANHDYISRQVLVQRVGKNRYLEVQSTTDLLDKEVSVVENSKYHKRLKAIDEEIGGGLQIQTFSNEENEETLISKVSSGEINFTLVDENIAKANKTYYDNLDISVPASLNHRAAWAVRNTSGELLDTVNSWFESIKSNYAYQYLEKKYFEKKKTKSRNTAQYPKYISNKKISNYDPLFKKYAPTLDWDWKLLASVAYQESKFNPEARSWAGAQGLMQLMPSTAEKFGVDSASVDIPEPNIRAAVKYIGRVEDCFKYIENRDERTKFVLAGYNAGVGHVRDAMALAEKHGKCPDKWSDVCVFVLLKSKPEFFNDPVVQHGYLRGVETTNFVDEVMLRYHEYNELIID